MKNVVNNEKGMFFFAGRIAYDRQRKQPLNNLCLEVIRLTNDGAAVVLLVRDPGVMFAQRILTFQSILSVLF